MHSEAYSDKFNVSLFTLSTSVTSFVLFTEVSFMLHLPREQPSSVVSSVFEIYLNNITYKHNYVRWKHLR